MQVFALDQLKYAYHLVLHILTFWSIFVIPDVIVLQCPLIDLDILILGTVGSA